MDQKRTNSSERNIACDRLRGEIYVMCRYAKLGSRSSILRREINFGVQLVINLSILKDQR